MVKRTPDPEVVRILEELEQQGRPLAALGRVLGLDPKQMNRLKNGERRLQLHEHHLATEFLGIGPVVLAKGGKVEPLPGLVPLYGWVGATSDSRLTFAEQNLRGFVPMHPHQQNVREPFALEVADVSMSPRYEPGEIVYLAPFRQPLPGQDCVVVTTHDEGMLKRFVRRTADNLVLHQLNPERDFTRPLSEIAAIHAVVGRG